MKIIQLAFHLISFILVVGVFKTEMTFGLGLGDLGMLFVLVLINLVVILINYLKKKIKIDIKYFNVLNICIIIATIIYFSLVLTIWRGSERPWNGDLFG